MQKAIIYEPWNWGAGTLKENTRNAMKQHLMYQKSDYQCTQLDSNDVKIGIQSSAYGRRVQKEHVRPFVRWSQSIFDPCLFLEKEHLKTQAREYIIKSKLVSSRILIVWYDAVLQRSGEFCENYATIKQSLSLRNVSIASKIMFIISYNNVLKKYMWKFF